MTKNLVTFKRCDEVNKDETLGLKEKSNFSWELHENQYRFKVLFGKKKGEGGVKGGIDAVMHTMKLDVLLHKTRIKVPRFGIYTYMISLSKIAHQLWYNIGRGEGVIK